MAEIITKERLQRLVDRLNKMTGQPMEPYTKDGNSVTPNPGNYHLDWALGKPALDQMSGSAGGGTRNIIERSSKKEMYYKLFAFIEGYEACERNAGHDVRKNPRSTNIAAHFKLDEFAANKAAELNNTIRYYVNEGIPLKKAIDMVKQETVAGPAVWKAVNAMLKKHPPKKSGRRTVKPRKNPRTKTGLFYLRAVDHAGNVGWYTGKAGHEFVSNQFSNAFPYESIEAARRKAAGLNVGTDLRGGMRFIALPASKVKHHIKKNPSKKNTCGSRRVKLIKPNPKSNIVVVAVRKGKPNAYLTGADTWDTDVKKARRFPTESHAKRVASAKRRVHGAQYQFGYKKL